MSKSALEMLQDDFAARLNSLEYFSDITVKSLRTYRGLDGVRSIADVGAQVDAALAGLLTKGGKTGAAVSVLTPALDVPHPNLPGPQGNILMTARIQEIPIINTGATGTGKSAESIALEVLAAGHHFRLAGICETLRASRNAATPNIEWLPKVTYDVQFEAPLALPVAAKCRAPAISVATLTVTLADQEGSAAVYYTTDDSFPWSGNAEATLYSAPFAVASGTAVRWAAYKTGKQGSDVGRQIV